jgi:TRAP-type C4-dicarboxylate transport system substrate-binding protein
MHLMETESSMTGRAVRYLAVVVLAAALAGCAEEGGGASTGGAGVEYGASKAEYQKAFENIEPVELRTQTPAPKGAVTGRNVEAYLNAITDWSGGKITFDVAYANAVAAPGENDDALVDGRLDLAQVLPLYEPSEYPANAALVEATFVSDQSAVAGTLQSNAWPNEVAFDTPEVLREWEDQGIKLMVPQYNSGVNVLFCREPKRDLAALRGMESASGGQAQSAEIEALGGSAVSVPYPELYESLQRGVVDCTVSSLTVGVLGGFIKTAPQLTVDPAAGFAMAPGGMAISQSTWDSLPLVAQQLMWDRMDVFLTSNIEEKIWPNTADAVRQAKVAGGSVEPFASDAQQAIQRANDGLLEKLGGTDAVADPTAFTTAIEESADRWLAAVEEVGIAEADVPYREFDTWYTDGKVDVDAYVKRVYEEIFLPHRPS